MAPRLADCVLSVPGDLLERLFDASPMMLCIADRRCRFQWVNPAFTDKLGHSRAAFLSRSFLEFVHPDDRASTEGEVDRLAAGHPSINFENRYRHADGSYRWLSWNVAPMAADGLLYATAADITNRKKADQELEALQAEAVAERQEHDRRLEILSNQLVLAEEIERRRIARGLHDDVAQSLLAAKMIAQELEEHLDDDKNRLTGELLQLLDGAIRSTRSLTFDLASEVLYDVGLAAAMQSLCERAGRRSGIRFEPPKHVDGSSLPEPVRVILFRVGRELVRNIEKHSQASTATLSLTQHQGQVNLIVEDDGLGFDVEEQLREFSAETGFGLFSIEQQLRPLGGRFDIESTSGKGTRARVVLPLRSEFTLP